MCISKQGEEQSSISIMGVCRAGKEKTMNEYAIEWTKDRNYAGVTVHSGTAWKTKLLRYAESHPEDVKVIAVNEDGSAFFHVPIAWIKCSPPRKVSEEQRVAAGERFRQMWENKKIDGIE